MSATQFTTPAGRLVYGSLYKPKTKDALGNPLVIKSGPNAGKPKTEYSFGLAIPKGSESHWNETEWGRKIYSTGFEAFPGTQIPNRPDFAWKILDGDSTVPNKNNKRPCDQEGYTGHWVLKFSSSIAPKIYKPNPNVKNSFLEMSDDGHIKTGFYIQVSGTVAGNNTTQNPGVYLNHSMICFVGYGEEIVAGADVANAGFGECPLPAGASATPLTTGFSTPSTLPPVPQTVTPQYFNIPSPPPLSKESRMTPKAKQEGLSYSALTSAGWTDEMLQAHGYMV